LLRKKKIHLHATKNAKPPSVKMLNVLLVSKPKEKYVDVLEYMEHQVCYLNSTLQIFFIYTTKDHNASPAEV